MFVGCSVINISFIAKQVQHVGIIRAFRLPRGDLLYTFFIVWGIQVAVCLGDQYPDQQYVLLTCTLALLV